MRQPRFERGTFGSGGRRSIQLSYWREREAGSRGFGGEWRLVEALHLDNLHNLHNLHNLLQSDRGEWI